MAGTQKSLPGVNILDPRLHGDDRYFDAPYRITDHAAGAAARAASSIARRLSGVSRLIRPSVPVR